MSKAIYWKLSTRTIRVIEAGVTVPVGFTSLGAINHPDESLDENGVSENHTIWHHIRDKLYAQGELDPSSFTIYINDIIHVYGVSVTPATATVTAAAGVNHTIQLTKTVAPTDATSVAGTWASSNAAKATVNSTGLVTGVAVGSTNVTFTTTDGSFVDTCVVTVAT